MPALYKAENGTKEMLLRKVRLYRLGWKFSMDLLRSRRLRGVALLRTLQYLRGKLAGGARIGRLTVVLHLLGIRNGSRAGRWRLGVLGLRRESSRRLVGGLLLLLLLLSALHHGLDLL